MGPPFSLASTKRFFSLLYAEPFNDNEFVENLKSQQPFTEVYLFLVFEALFEAASEAFGCRTGQVETP